MNVFTRGIRNAFRNIIRTVSLVFILGLSIGLALSMLVARQAVEQKIDTVKSSVGNTISISPAGVRGFGGGGNPLTETQLASVKSLTHVTALEESLTDRLTTSDTNLVSSISAGSLGQRFAQNGGGGNFSGGFGGSNGGTSTATFTVPVSVLGSTNPTDLTTTMGGGTFTLKSGDVFASNSTSDVALVGTGLASKNNLKVGSTFTAYNSTFTVVGIYDAGNTFSNAELIMPLATLQTASAQVGDVTSATATVDSISNVDSTTSAIEKVLGSAADVTNSSEQAQQTLTPLQNIETISLYSLIGSVIAGSVIILLTMIMIVRERRREIGVIKAIGASNFKVMLQFTTEAITLTLLGAVIGIVLGVVAGNPITKLLVNNSTSTTTTSTAAGTAGQFGGGFRAGSPNSSGTTGGRQFVAGGRGAFGTIHNSLINIHAAVGWNIILYGLGAAIIIAIAGSTIAAFFISKIRPAEVMRVE